MAFTRPVTKHVAADGAQIVSIDNEEAPQTLVVDAGTGTVSLEVQLDSTTDEWITHETYTVDGITKVEANGCNVRITATGDAAFAFIRS